MAGCNERLDLSRKSDLQKHFERKQSNECLALENTLFWLLTDIFAEIVLKIVCMEKKTFFFDN